MVPVERDVVSAALGGGVDEPPELARRRVEQRLQPQALQRLSQLVRLLDLESGQLHGEVVDGVEAGLDLGHHALQRLRGQPGGSHLRKEVHSNGLSLSRLCYTMKHLKVEKNLM